jgi:hypothetical protein
VKEDKIVTLILKFSEVYFRSSGDKQFDVKLGDTFIYRDVDPFKLAHGKYSPFDIFVELVIR